MEGINLEGSPSLITNGTASDASDANGDSISSTATSPTIIIQYIETTANPSSQPSAQPSLASSIIPSAHPNSMPSDLPSIMPTTYQPTDAPSTRMPTRMPSKPPSLRPTLRPTPLSTQKVRNKRTCIEVLCFGLCYISSLSLSDNFV